MAAISLQVNLARNDITKWKGSVKKKNYLVKKKAKGRRSLRLAA